MKQSPELNMIQEKMKPGQLTVHGFLGEDDRNITDIIDEDDKNIKKVDLSHEMIANRMKYFTEIGTKNLGDQVKVDDFFLVSVDDHRGFVPCPFADNHKSEKRNTKLENTKLNVTVYWSDLNIHMIEKHGFYEGKGSFFRIESSQIGRILGMR